EWVTAQSHLVTVVSSGLNNPNGVAMDHFGNLYIADFGIHAIKEWVAASNTLVTLYSSPSISPSAIAVDLVGNVFFVDANNDDVDEWSPATGNIMNIMSGVVEAWALNCDGAGNVYCAEDVSEVILEWVAVSNTVVAACSAPIHNYSVA